MILVVCPTVDGREESLARCVESYEIHTERSHEMVIVRNEPTCGAAWNVGLDRAWCYGTSFEWVHLTADDIEATAGWDDSAVHWIRSRGELPAPRVLHTDGTLQSCGDTATEVESGTPTELTRVPFFHRSLLPVVAPIIETHYYTDSWVSYQARRVGIPTTVCREYCLYHHFAQPGRLDERLDPDYAEFVRRRDLHPIP